MASQPKEPEAELDDTGTAEAQSGPRDYETEARAHGWRPREEFKGDPDLWADAETFIRNADEKMPLLKQKNRSMEREIRELRQSTLRMQDQFTKAEQRLRAELTTKMERAVETGDVTEFRRLKGEHDEIAAPAASAEEETKRASLVLLSYRKDNPWFDEGALPSAGPADRRAAARIRQIFEEQVLEGLDKGPPEAFFKRAFDQLKEEMPDLGRSAPREKPGSDVAGVTRTGAGRRGGKTFADLPADAQRMCDKWVKQGLLKDRAAYVATYDFGA